MYACILLPFPPSTNNLFVNNPRTRGRFPSRQYKEWQEAADRALAKQDNLPRFDEPVVVTVTMGRPDNRRRDICNFEKAPIDRLVHRGVLADDSLIEDIRLRWCNDTVGVQVEIETMTDLHARQRAARFLA